MTIPSQESFRDIFSKTLGNAGFTTKSWSIDTNEDPLVLAENPYYIIAFQVYEIWHDLATKAKKVELALSDLVSKSGPNEKRWDAYLVLICRNQPRGLEELNELSRLIYDTQFTRKIIRAGLGDSLDKTAELAKPFISLQKARYSAKHRDPLELLKEKLMETECDQYEIEKLITAYRERGDLDNVQ